MVTQLTVVNDCLAIMGEAPLNTLSEEHAFKAAALGVLSRVTGTVLAKGWWFNLETLTLTASPVDGRLYLPSDVGTVLPFHKDANLAQRGRVLYNLTAGTDVFEQGFATTVRLTRLLPLEDCPSSVADLIAARVVLEFQTQYDGDQTKTRNLGELVGTLTTLAMAEHIRNRRVNLVHTSERLARITNVINYSRRPG